jgi:hypothetical protein
VRGADEPEYGEEMYESKWKESIERGYREAREEGRGRMGWWKGDQLLKI